MSAGRTCERCTNGIIREPDEESRGRLVSSMAAATGRRPQTAIAGRKDAARAVPGELRTRAVASRTVAPRAAPRRPPAVTCRRAAAVMVSLSEERVRELWSRYKNQGDFSARERLILAYAPLVKYVAGRMSSGLPAHIEEADLISYGLLGLIGAVERFDPGRAIKFETFAVSRIKGSIIDELRSLDWVPRSVRSKAQRDRARVRQARERAPAGAHGPGDLRRPWGSPRTSSTTPSRRSPPPPSSRWTSCGRSAAPRATRPRSSRPSKTPRAAIPPACWTSAR